MTLIEELKALDLACGEPDNIYIRALDELVSKDRYIHQLQEEIDVLEEGIGALEAELHFALEELRKLRDE